MRGVLAALMLGREGSVGFPGKNTAMVLGRPMMAYPLLAAKHAEQVDEVFVSTDSPRIREIAREYGASVIDRPPDLCTAAALGEDAFVHGYEYIRDVLGKRIDLMVLLFCNGVTVTARVIEQGIQALWRDPTLDSAVTVSRYNMWSPLRARKVSAEGLLEPFIPLDFFGDQRTLNCDRNSQGDVWFADMGVSIVRPHCLEDINQGVLPQKWMGRRIYPIKQWGGLDVDYEWQIPQVEFWLKKHDFTETRTPYDKEGS